MMIMLRSGLPNGMEFVIYLFDPLTANSGDYGGNWQPIVMESMFLNSLSLPHMLMNQFKNLLSIGLSSGYEFKELKEAKEAKEAAPA